MRPWAPRPQPARAAACGGPSPPSTSWRILAEYEAAPSDGAKGAMLRREGLYTSHIVEWRRARDAGALAGLAPRPRPRTASRRAGRDGPPAAARRAGRGGAGQGTPGHRHPGKSIRALGRLLAESDEDPRQQRGDRRRVHRARAAGGHEGGLRGGGPAPGEPLPAGPPAASRTAGPGPRRPTRCHRRGARRPCSTCSHSQRFVDRAPAQAWATLLDEGTYLASESRCTGCCEPTARCASGAARRPIRRGRSPSSWPTDPNEVWSYDATALRGPDRGRLVRPVRHARHLQPLLPRLDGRRRARTARSCETGSIGSSAAQGAIPEGTLTIHADRGSAHDLQARRRAARGPAHRAHPQPAPRQQRQPLLRGRRSRPSSTARTSPGASARIAGRPRVLGPFFDLYNHHHRHSGHRLHTPASVHFGTAAEVRAERATVLDAAYAAHPERFVNQAPVPPPLPVAAWINKPKPNEEAAQNKLEKVSQNA